jgi:hypothetical protein
VISARTGIDGRRSAVLGLLVAAVVLSLTPSPAVGRAGAVPTAGSERFWRVLRTLPAVETGSLRAVACRSATDVWMVGSATRAGSQQTYGLVRHWNGATWRDVPGPVPGTDVDVQLSDVDALPAGDVVAVGRSRSGSRTVPRIEQYPAGGGAGRVIPNPESVIDGAWQGIDLRSATDGWMVGLSGSVAEEQPAQTLIARWDGDRWQRVPSPSPGTLSSQLTAVTAYAENDAWAVGEVRDATDPKAEKSLVLHWDGSTWSQVASPSPGGARTTLLGVAAAGPDDVWAVGFTTASPADTAAQRRAVALHWTGGSWQVIRSTKSAATEYSDVVAISPHDVVLAGYQTPFGVEDLNVERWDGAAFRQNAILLDPVSDQDVASALNGLAAEPNGGRLWAAGWRTTKVQPSKQPGGIVSNR